MELPTILERELTSQRPAGGNVTNVELRQTDEGEWFINLSVSWKGEGFFNVCLYSTRRLRLYKRLSSAVAHVVCKYDYTGRIVVYPNMAHKDEKLF